jgi:Fe-S cluster biogenesis protein NfuA
MLDATGEFLKARVAEILAQEVSAVLALGEASLEVLEVREGVARIKLGGACGGCPSSIMTVVMGIEEALRSYLPEVAFVEFVP